METKNFELNINLNQFVSSSENCHLYEQLDSIECDYIENYGDKYCNIYLSHENELSEIGQKWSQNVRQCLQDNLIEIIQNTNSCNTLKVEAIHGHKSCYLDGEISFFDIPVLDQLLIARYAKKNLETLSEAIDIYREFIPHTIDQINNYFYGTKHNNIVSNENIINDLILDLPHNNNQCYIDNSLIENQSINVNNDENVTLNIPDETQNENLLPNGIQSLGLTNSTLNLANSIVHFHEIGELNSIVSGLNSSLTILNNFLHNESLQDLGQMFNIIQKLAINQHMKVEQFAFYIVECVSQLPLSDFKKLIKDIIHHNNIDQSLFRVVLDIAEMINPIFFIYDYGTSIIGLLTELITHHDNIKVGGVDCHYSERSTAHNIGFLKWEILHRVELQNDFFGIDVHCYGDHIKDAEAKVYEEFKKQLREKYYLVTGNPYFDDLDYGDPKTRYEKYCLNLLFKLCHEKWVEINEVSEKDEKIYNKFNSKSEEEIKLEIKDEIMEIKNSFWHDHCNENPIDFLNNLFNNLINCQNSTELSESLYSLFFKTGQDIHFSEIFLDILELLNIDTKCFVNYVNHKNNNLNGKKLEDAVDKEYNKEKDSFTNVMTEYRNKQTKLDEENLKNSENKNINDYNENKENYSRFNIIKRANFELLKNEISMKYIGAVLYSSIISNACFSIIYFDAEKRKYKYTKNYYSYKLYEISSGSIQNYSISMIVNHSMCTFGLIPMGDDFTIEFLDEIINPNLSFMLSTLYIHSKTPHNTFNNEHVFNVIDGLFRTNSRKISKMILNLSSSFYSNCLAIEKAGVSALGYSKAVLYYPLKYLYLMSSSFVKMTTLYISPNLIGILTTGEVNAIIISLLLIGTSRLIKEFMNFESENKKILEENSHIKNLKYAKKLLNTYQKYRGTIFEDNLRDYLIKVGVILPSLGKIFFLPYFNEINIDVNLKDFDEIDYYLNELKINNNLDSFEDMDCALNNSNITSTLDCSGDIDYYLNSTNINQKLDDFEDIDYYLNDYTIDQTEQLEYYHDMSIEVF